MTDFAQIMHELAAALALAEPDTLGEVFIADTKNAVETGVSGIWVLANMSYAGMRAQGSPSMGWRGLAFVFGFPGTVLTLLTVKNGSNWAYGVFVPPRPPNT